MKTLVTHINPHLDDIAAIWLFKKFYPQFRDAKVEFLSAAKQGVTFEGKPVDANPDVVHFGIGRGKYDEHKGDIGESAGSLVWKDIKDKGLAPKEIEFKALEELVEWNNLIDTGQAPNYEFSEFSVQSFIRPLDSKAETSQKALQLGEEILDRILNVLKRKQQSLLDWENRVEFTSKFGKSYAVSSEAVDRAFCKKMGGDLFIIYNPKYKSVQFFTPSQEIDLTPIYEKVKSMDPDADWYFHQSHHILLCGSHTAPDSKPTKLSFEQLIEVAKG